MDVLGSTRLQQGINPAQGVFIEMFVTSYLVLAVLMLAVEKHHVTPFAPVSPSYQRIARPVADSAHLPTPQVGIGLTLFVCEMCESQYDWLHGGVSPVN
jgi:hypothetical protein